MPAGVAPARWSTTAPGGATPQGPKAAQPEASAEKDVQGNAPTEQEQGEEDSSARLRHRMAVTRVPLGGEEVLLVGGLTADDVDAVTFHAARLRHPYDMGAVDDFVDALATVMRKNVDPSGLLERLPFPEAAGSGYRRREVDRFVERLLGEA